MTTRNILIILILVFNGKCAFGQPPAASFSWPGGKRTAISFTFDDARASQVNGGTALLDKYGVKATFFVLPDGVEKQLQGWKKAVASGHEIGNHSNTHPCSSNFAFSRKNALEDKTLEQLRNDLTEGNKRVQKLLGVTPEVFAYPCGNTFVGRGVNTKSYVPLVAEIFLLGRTWSDEEPNDPLYSDFAQLTCIDMDGKTFEQLLPVLERAKANGLWIVFGGHEMAESGDQTTRLSTVKKLIDYTQDPANGVWVAPAGEVAKYVLKQR